ncbi:MAG: shikimate dehydrogenase [Acholeplasmataceae bacterium]|jgi:shikimate dehydrogenase|nr:shikimate dehydrogenase [Acholeplasmataceae bacterium]
MSDRYGLLGKNITYSKSPKIHTLMAKRLGMDITYDLLDVSEDDLPKFIKQLRQGIFKGFNVTIPYKQKILPFLDELTPKAKRIRAVNTIYLKNDKVIGDNTDYDGFLGLITKHQIDVKDKQVCILGSGGAAKAVYTVLSDLGAHIVVVSRQIEDHDPLFKKVITYDALKHHACDIFVHTTPIGTAPKVDASVLSASEVNHALVIDLIYQPPVTQLMRFAKESYNGLYMLMIQALKSEEIWFDRKIDLNDQLMEILKEVIYR